MPRSTVYVVQFFSRAAAELVAEPPLAYNSEDEAVGRAGRGMKAKAGVLVTAITGDPDADDWDEPEVLLKAGELPRGLADED